MTNKVESSQEMRRLIRERYPSEGFAVLDEVPAGTGAAVRGFVDCIVMSLWPSRGLEIIGVEIKVSRSDWIRELKQPGKADELWRYCDRWYLAVGDLNIVRAGELPKGWGLLYPANKGLRAKVEAPIRKDAIFNRQFLASVLRRVCRQTLAQAKLDAATKEGFRQGEARAREEARHEMNQVRSEMNTLRDTISKFETVSGVDITGWSGPEKIGQAVRAVLNGEHEYIERRLKGIHGHLKQLTTDCERSIASLDKK